MNYLDLANGGISKVKPYVAGKPIEELERELNIHNIIKLASNENPYGMSKKAKEAVSKYLDKVHLYPDSNSYYLKEKLSQKFNVPMDQISLGDGSNELINLIFQCFANDKVNVVVPALSFIVYKMGAVVNGAEFREVALTDDYKVNCDNILNAIDANTRLVVLTNPANPTGTAIYNEELFDFINKVPKHVMVILDEAYVDFCQNLSSTERLLDTHDNVIITRTFSKAYGLAGLRIGYMFANKEITSLIERLRAPFNVNLLAQIAAIATIEDTEYLDYVVTENNKERLKYEVFCKKHNLDFIKSETNFITIDFKDEKKALFLNSELLKRGIIVRPLVNYGMGKYLRISFGTQEENDRLFKELEDLLNA